MNAHRKASSLHLSRSANPSGALGHLRRATGLSVLRKAPEAGPGSIRGNHASGGGRFSPAGKRHKRTVAIVEDQEDSLVAYAGYLRKHGYDSVFTFATGEGFEQAVEEGRLSPELVLVDYRLPGKNGIETAKGVSEGHPRMKVIVTTADDSVRRKARLLGFHFLQKPFSLASLTRMMDGL